MAETLAMTHPKKIVYIISHMDWFWSHRVALAQGAKDAGWNVTVAAPGAQADTKLVQHGFKAIELADVFSGFSPIKAVRFFKALRDLQKNLRPDIIHAITLKCAFFAGLASRFESQVKPVHTIAGLGYLFSGDGLKPKILRMLVYPFLKIALSHPRAQIIFQNNDDRMRFIRMHLVRSERAHLIQGSGVDIHQFRPTEELYTDMPLVVMPTRLLHDKGVRIFVEAARILKSRGAKARFAIAGGLWQGNPRAITEAEMQNMVADGAVEWLGKVTDMPALLASCALVVYPSWYREGVPKVLLEAAAAGRGIVTTDHPGCREAVTHHLNGLLVPIKNARATADAIEILLHDPMLRTQMGMAGRRRAEEEFNVGKIVTETLRLY
ncbi:MAG: glycosyltransferase family 4 protein [Alphaproteobacteria bacterium]